MAMADRILAGIALLIAIGYSFIAFTIIKAPFQYDPLGPESWPRILGLLCAFCAAWIVWRPDVDTLGVNKATWLRLLVLVVLLLGYAWGFQPAGFVLSTFVFCVALSLMLGAKPLPAIGFGVITSVAGYLVATVLLELNLPAGLLEPLE
jgi:putative tricarboxylic transport membrane protein